jgi:hypothetical protein
MTMTSQDPDQEIKKLRQAAKCRELHKIQAGLKGKPLTEADLQAALAAAYEAGQEEMRSYTAAVNMTDTYNASLRG